jgi:hypothetical protein
MISAIRKLRSEEILVGLIAVIYIAFWIHFQTSYGYYVGNAPHEHPSGQFASWLASTLAAILPTAALGLALCALLGMRNYIVEQVATRSHPKELAKARRELSSLGTKPEYHIPQGIFVNEYSGYNRPKIELGQKVKKISKGKSMGDYRVTQIFEIEDYGQRTRVYGIPAHLWLNEYSAMLAAAKELETK